MISTKALLDAQMDTSKNDLLSSVFDTVALYNSGAVASNDRSDMLERILVGCGTWLASHPPHPSPKNNARWKAMQVLANEVAAEAARVGVKFLTAPKDWKATANNRRNYWLEMLSPVHGAGFELSAPFSDWMRFAPKEQSFWEYMRIRPLLNPKHVQYFSGVQAELYRMEFKPDGKLYRVHDGALFDTRGLETCFSGLGWAIFVVSPTGQLYSHKHVEGTFHHSSFLGGSAVMAAGEILVVNGDVRIITAKSGHYKPTPENISNMVKIFPQLPRNAIIFPNFLPDPPPAHTIAEYRFSGNKATLVKRAKVEAKLTGESDNPSSRAWIDKVPA